MISKSIPIPMQWTPTVFSCPCIPCRTGRKFFIHPLRISKEQVLLPPIAHRAGAYAIDRETLNLLPEFGICMDSSIFPVDSRSQVPLPEDLSNRFVQIGGIYQLPMTLIKRFPFIGYAGMTAFDLDRTIWEEQRKALELIADHGLPLVTFSLHFHSLCHCEDSPVPYRTPRSHRTQRGEHKKIG